MTWLAGLPSKLWGYVGAALAGLALLWTAREGWRRAGRAEAERRALGQDLANRKVRDAVEMDLARRPDPAADLLRDWRRD